MKNDIVDAAHGSLAFVSGAFNLALVGGFAYATVCLWSLSSSAFEKAGGFPQVSLQALEAMAVDPDILNRGQNYALAWGAAVAMAGCAFMTALGLRWGRHALSRALLRFRD
jgi:hypothetical protein